ncbi:hypothetical protein KIN20_024265 [Parelaphostrongylus tenuis]|uniref:Uncharacterized protein n=1 Tax=Parelaphostrongylus tenuis TaxID=148309 RepID=A0AAD5NCQ5_PARTN|nr:hypothetical protein KIN20_024265 [Parelaphostrongylus tenuis]
MMQHAALMKANDIKAIKSHPSCLYCKPSSSKSRSEEIDELATCHRHLVKHQ